MELAAVGGSDFRDRVRLSQSRAAVRIGARQLLRPEIEDLGLGLLLPRGDAPQAKLFDFGEFVRRKRRLHQHLIDELETFAGVLFQDGRLYVARIRFAVQA